VGNRALLILDFDGVICDSLPECFASSWYAYHELRTGTAPASTPRDAFERFSSMRPYIRSGEDYLLIQELISSGGRVSGQKEFDALVARAGEETMRRYKSLLYEARDRLIAEAPAHWYALNPVYAHMRGGMMDLAPGKEVFILSTKRASFISRILDAAGIAFPEANVLYSGPRPKVDMIRELFASTGSRRAVFVDDQVDHFSGAREWSSESGIIECRLATWGYVKPEWIAATEDYRPITPSEARELLDRYARGGPR
jgi:phosphoglycolate phosphatase-like HAD superfamily hydrolase